MIRKVFCHANGMDMTLEITDEYFDDASYEAEISDFEINDDHLFVDSLSEQGRKSLFDELKKWGLE